MCKSFSHSPQKLTFHMTGNQQEIVITFCSYVGVSYQKTPNCLPSLFFFSRYLSKAETTVDFLNICAGKCHLSSDLAISIRNHRFEQTLPSHRHGLGRAHFSWARCYMGRCFGLPEPQGTLPARSYFNQGIISQPRGSKSPQSSAVTPYMPLKPGRTLSFWQCPNHDQNKAVQAAQ